MFLYEITDAFKKSKLKYAIVGGYALALHGVVRATVDIDLVIELNLSSFEKAEKILKEVGLKPRLPISADDLIKMRKEYIENRNLLAWSFVDYGNPTRQVDILIHKGLDSIAVERISVATRKLSVVSLEDLLQMKIESGRPQDIIDIESIKEKIYEKKRKK